MAHGYLTPTPVSGRSPIEDMLAKKAKQEIKKALRQTYSKLKDILSGFKGFAKSKSGAIVQYSADVQNVSVKEVSNTEPSIKKMFSGSNSRMLGAGNSSIAKQEVASIPGGSGGIAKRSGGAFTEMPGISSGGGLNAETFFKQATTGVGPSGEYLTNAQRREAFIKSRQEAEKVNSAAPPISPDSGVDIVAAVNRNTQMIVSLVEAVKEQTKTDIRLSEKQEQTSEKLMLRAAAKQEEADLEKGSDLSGFMTPEFFKKVEKNASGDKNDGKGGGGIRSAIGSAIGGAARGAAKKKIIQGGIRKGIRGGPGAAAGAAKGGGGILKGLGRFAKGAGPLAILGAGLEFGGRKAEGQTNVQAGLGTAASVAGGLAGAAKGAALGAALGSVIPGLGTAVGGVLGGLIGGFGGSALAGGAADLATGAFADGGLITRPTFSMMGEGNRAEGVFPLEGTRGKKTFRMFGEGLLNAQLNNDTDFAKLQAKGMKQYFEVEGGGKKLGESLKDFFGNLAGGIASLFGGAANAAEFNPADYLGGGDFAGGGQDMMTLATIAALESGSAQGQADVAQSVYNRLADKTYGKSITDILTRQGQYQVAFKDPTASSGAGTQVADEFKNIRTEDDAVKAMMYYYNKRGMKMTAEQARQKLRGSVAAIQNTELQKKAAQHVGGRTEFLSAGSNVPGAAWRGSGSDNKFFAAYGSGKQMARGAAAAPTGLFMPAGGGGGGGNASIAAAAQSLKGMDTSGGPGGGSVSCVYAVNKVFAKAGVKPPWGGAQSSDAVINAARKAGWQQVGFGDARPGDLWAYDANDGRSGHVGIMMPNGKVLSNSTSQKKFVWEADKGQLLNAYPKNGMTPPGGVFFRPPGGNSGGSVARSPGGGGGGTTMSPIFQRAAAPVPASAANPSTGTSIAAASQQVAMASMGSGTGSPTIVNNYYGGGSQGGPSIQGGSSPGISMEQTGTAIFQELRIRTLA